MAEQEPGACKLDVHVRRVASGSGTIARETEVYCPHRDRSMAVAACEACPEYVGGGADAATGRTYVLCRRLTAASARSLRQARSAYVVHRLTSEGSSAAERTPVGAIMTREILCVRADLALATASALFERRHVSGAPVVNEDGEPIRMVSKADLLPAGDANLVADVMTHLTVVLPETSTISQAAAFMSYENVDRLPIVSEDGKVSGIVSALDLLRWFARSDGYVLPDAHPGLAEEPDR